MLVLRRRPEITLRLVAAFSQSGRSFSKDYDSSDDEKDKKQQKPKPEKTAKEPEQQEETAAAKLNRLLASMTTDDPYSITKNNANTLATPGSTNRKKREAVKEEIAKKDIFKAAKNVASVIGDEQQQKQTESELLAKLLGQTDDNTKKVDGSAAKAEPNSDLSLSELIVGMKIDRNPKQQENLSRSEYVRRTLAAARSQQQERGVSETGRSSKRQPRKREAETYTGSVDLYGAEPLGIFKNVADLKESQDILSTWSHLQTHDLQLQVAHPPSNYFEKIALWTEQGKVWRFPIDNEQDWQLEEDDVDFSEHIFLEQHLESWCPTKGPIRHFMELVCVGLSKNPYITAREKKEHILWYRNYFEDRRELIKEYMFDTPKDSIEKEKS